MSASLSRYVTVGDFEIHYTEWGTPENPPVLCWHGLTRNGRDFDAVASFLADEFHVICPDTIGRGKSQWSQDPPADYCFARYHDLAVGLLDKLGIETFRWVGTSMGGALGIRLAGTELKARISHLVLNDIGAGPTEEYLARVTEPAKGMQDILTYTANPPEFSTLSGLIGYYKAIYSLFGIVSDEEWISFTEHSARRKDNGMFSPDYDPRIVAQFNHPEDLLLWKEWDEVTAKVLLLRGEHSTILPIETADAMRSRGPGFEFKEFAGIGHAPALNTKEQMELVRSFLTR